MNTNNYYFIRIIRVIRGFFFIELKNCRDAAVVMAVDVILYLLA